MPNAPLPGILKLHLRFSVPTFALEICVFVVARDLTAAGLYTTAPDYASAYTTKFPSGVRP